jgi:hypothetical protein
VRFNGDDAHIDDQRPYFASVVPAVTYIIRIDKVDVLLTKLAQMDYDQNSLACAYKVERLDPNADNYAKTSEGNVNLTGIMA